MCLSYDENNYMSIMNIIYMSVMKSKEILLLNKERNSFSQLTKKKISIGKSAH
jgi:hypothetical protein